MPDLESNPTVVVASILPDVKGMRRPSGGTLEIDQSVPGDPRGQTQLRFAYTEPDLSEPWYERVDIDGAGVPSKDLEGTPIAASSLSGEKIDAAGGPGKGDTTVSLATAAGDVRMTVGSTTDFAAGDRVEIGAGPSLEYAKVRLVLGPTVLEFDSPLFFAHAPLETVKELTTTAITVTQTGGGGDIEVDLATGQLTVNAPILNGTSVLITYCQQGFFGSMRLFVVRNAVVALATGDHYSIVSAELDFALLASPAPGSSPFTATLPVGDNGKDFLVGMASADASGNVGPVTFLTSGPMTTVPDIPQNTRITDLQVNPPRVKLEWDGATAGHKAGVSHNVYRNNGDTVDPANRALAAAVAANEVIDQTGLVAGQDFTYSIARQVPAAAGVTQSRRIQSAGQPAQAGSGGFAL